MKIKTILQFVILLVIAIIVLLSGIQLMMDKNYYTVRAVVSNVTSKVTHSIDNTETAQPKEVISTNTGPQLDWETLFNISEPEQNTRQKDKHREVLVTSSISEVQVQKAADRLLRKHKQDRSRQIVESHSSEYKQVPKGLSEEEKQAIFEPVKISYQAALFNFSGFHQSDFKSEKPIIPHIIHQIWDSYEIPVMFKKWIKTIVELHPDWEYWFWSVADAECLIRKKYPQYLDIFKRYPQNIFRTDAFRYFVLYDYGGFYIDLDVEALKPLDFWTYYYPAVISWENYEHTYLSHKKKEPNIMTTVLASKPNHPFFKMLQIDLVKNASSRDVLQATGPFFLHRTFKKYRMSSQSKTNNSSIMTIHPKYWLPRHDNYIKTASSCRVLYYTLTRHGKAMCDELGTVHYTNSIKPESFLNHFWVHVNMWKTATRSKMQRNVFHIKEVVPHAKLVSQILKC